MRNQEHDFISLAEKEIFIFLAAFQKKVRSAVSAQPIFDQPLRPATVKNYYQSIGSRIEDNDLLGALQSLKLAFFPYKDRDPHTFVSPGGGLTLAMFLDQDINNFAQKGGQGKDKGLAQVARWASHLVNLALINPLVNLDLRDPHLVEPARTHLEACQKDYLHADLFCPCQACNKTKGTIAKYT